MMTFEAGLLMSLAPSLKSGSVTYSFPKACVGILWQWITNDQILSGELMSLRMIFLKTALNGLTKK